MPDTKSSELSVLTACDDTADRFLIYDQDAATLKTVAHDDISIKGTFSPAIEDAASGGNASPTAANLAYYSRIGSMMFVHIYFANISTAGMVPGSDIFITGLPVAARAGGSTSYPGFGGLTHCSVTGQVNPYVDAGNSYIKLGETMTAGASDSVIVSELTSGSSNLFISLWYPLA